MYFTIDGWPFGWVSNTTEIPEGYDLVEKPEHKKERLGQEIKSLEIQVEWHSGQGAAAADKLKETKKELKDLEK